jgi:hypothetical protein
MPAFLLFLVSFLQTLRTVYNDAAPIVSAISAMLQEKLPDHAQRIEEILPTKAPGADDLDAELADDLKKAGG